VRKRIAIALLILSVIGVVAFFVSQPKKGSVEWHKREYKKARRQYAMDSLPYRARRAYAILTRTEPPRFTEEERRAIATKVLAHEGALLQLGFLGARKVPADGTNLNAVLDQMRSEEGIVAYALGRLRYSPNYQFGGTGAFIELTAPVNDLPKWETLLREGAGVHKTGK
jgi:hypothetical protein